MMNADNMLTPGCRFFFCCLLLLSCCLTAQSMTGQRPDSIRARAAGGRELVPARKLARTYNMQYRAVPGEGVTLHSRWSELHIEEDSRRTRLNGILLWLHQPSGPVGSDLGISITDVDTLVDPLLRTGHYLQQQGRGVIMLDPGHGGRDRGARGARNVEEKRVVLDVARRTRNLLTEAGFQVYLTRDSDIYLSLAERVAAAARRQPDLFVSIHLNATAAPNVNGIETYILTAPGEVPTNRPGSSPGNRNHPGHRHLAASAALGYSLQGKLLAELRLEDRGLRRAEFTVLRDVDCPAALVECGFVSHPEQEARYLEAEYRQRIAAAITAGIREYCRLVAEAQKTP